MRNRDLWQALEAFEIGDPAAPFSFTARLARENGWSRAMAAAALREYRRFVYLMAVAPWPVTPSDIVDRVWHLHLTYTQSYWQEMCAGLIGRPLHHGPTRGGPAEDAKYRDWYARTLALYAEEFGAPPPPALWPPAEMRFASARHQRWVDTREVWIVGKPGPRLRAGLAAGLAGGLALAALAGAPQAGMLARADLLGTWGWIALGALVLVVIVALVAGRPRGPRRRRKGDGSSDGTTTTLAAGAGGTRDKTPDATGKDKPGIPDMDGAGNGSGCGGGGGCSGG